MISALYRKRREQALSERQLHQALSGVESILRIFQVEPLAPSVLDTATQLIRTHGSERALRTLDALHLATFVLRAGPEWQFVVADHRLDAVAQEEGVDTIRPSREA